MHLRSAMRYSSIHGIRICAKKNHGIRLREETLGKETVVVEMLSRMSWSIILCDWVLSSMVAIHICISSPRRLFTDDTNHGHGDAHAVQLTLKSNMYLV